MYIKKCGAFLVSFSCFSLSCLFLRALSYSTCLSIFDPTFYESRRSARFARSAARIIETGEVITLSRTITLTTKNLTSKFVKTFIEYLPTTYIYVNPLCAPYTLIPHNVCIVKIPHFSQNVVHVHSLFLYVLIHDLYPSTYFISV